MTPYEIAVQALRWFEYAILAYFLLVNTTYLVLLTLGAFEMRAHLLRIWAESRWRVLRSPVAPRISILVPAHDESATIETSLRALLALHYPNLEAVVVNDGSEDDTLEVLKRAFELVAIHPIYRRQVEHAPVLGLYRSQSWPNLVVLDKEKGGKADSLNAGLNLCSGELVCAVDADTLIEADALQRMVRPFLTSDEVVAAGGTLRVVNGSVVESGQVVEALVPRRFLPGVQTMEYLRSFLFGRLGLNRLGGNLIISGAFGLFRRDAILDAGGYRHDTVGEDLEIVVHLRTRGREQGTASRVAFVPDPVAWTEVPATLGTLGRQRDRWHRGLADVLWQYRRMFLNPRYGSMGMVVYPYFLVIELLSPVVEAAGLLGILVAALLGQLSLTFLALFFLVAYVYGTLLSMYTLVLEEVSFRRYQRWRDRRWLVLWALLEQIGYRQLTVFWRLRGLLRFFLKHQEWGRHSRRGFGPEGGPPAGGEPPAPEEASSLPAGVPG